MKIGIASDHHGIRVKEELMNYLNKKGNEVVNYGPDTRDSVDYPEYAFKIGNAIKNKEIELGILICKTGIGMSIAVNKVNGVRCAKVDNIKDARLTREHNDANVIAISADEPLFKLKDIIDVFIRTKFSSEERHQRRIDLINNYKNDN